MRIEAAVVREIGGPFTIESVELDDPKEGEILVKMTACGICSADLAARDHLHPIPLPGVFGHEGSGVVEKVGAGVKNIIPGDHVVLHPYACGECEMCKRGHPAYCLIQGRINFGGKHSDGTYRLHDSNGVDLSTFFNQSSFATYAVSSEKNATKVDKNVDLALLGPLGCGIQTGVGTVVNKLHPRVGESISLFGCGSVGLSAIMAAHTAGCLPIIGIDVVQERLDLALELGATHVINAKNTSDISAEIQRITKGGSDYSVDTSAIPAMAIAGLGGLKYGGRMAVVGTSGDRITEIKMQEAIMRTCHSLEGMVQGDSIPDLFIPKIIELYQAGRLPFDKLIRFYDFDEINQAVADMANGTTIKPVLRF